MNPGRQLIGVRREVTAMDRPHRGAGVDVEARHEAELAGQLLEDVAEDADLVGAACSTAREHDCAPDSLARRLDGDVLRSAG